jgi:energy-converting hydrogenase Eha subunit G
VGSWYPAGFPTLAEWNAWMFGFTAVSVISGILIYVISQRARKGKTDEELIAAGAVEREVAEDMPSPG